MGNETKFTYASFDLDTATLQNRINIVKKERRYDENEWGYAENQINSIILAIADNNYEAKGIRTFKLLEELIEWAGYDKEGHYSKEAKAAMENLYQDQIRQGLNPRKRELQDRELDTPWQAFVKKAKEKIKFKMPKIEIKMPKFKFPKVPEKVKKGLKVAAGAVSFAVISAVGYLVLDKSVFFEKFDFRGKNKTEQKAKTITEVQDSTKTKVLSMKDMRSSSREKIEANKKAYQNKVTYQSSLAHQMDSTLSAGHEIRLNAFYGAKKANKLVEDMQAKLKAGLLDSGKYTATDLVYYKKMVETYVAPTDANYKLVHDVLGTDKKVSAEQNKAFLDYLSTIGDNGENLQAKVLKSGKKVNHNSSIDKAPASVKAKFVQNKKHYKNLKQLKQAKLHAQKLAQR